MARIALLISLVACAAALSSNLESQAWLRKHQNPNADELDELKGDNPEAYAIVKALLTKRALGLLDPKHPTASFSAAKPATLSPDQQGPEAFAKFASVGTPVENSADPAETMYPEAPVHQEHKDFFNWKPSASGADDDAEVQNVLGAVAAAAQSKPAATPETKSFNSDVPAQQVEKPVAAMGQENSYLKGMDFGVKTPVQAQRTTIENSYLRGSGLVEDEADPKTEKLTQMGAPKEDFLASFSWNDEPKPHWQPPAHHRSSLAVESSSVATEADSSSTQAKAKAGKPNSFFAWLDGNSAASPRTAKAVAPATTASPQNAYMMDLS